MNNRQTFIIALTILISILGHAFITKPVPVNYNVTMPGHNPYEVYPGRYERIENSPDRFDTVTGDIYSPEGRKYQYPKSIEK